MNDTSELGLATGPALSGPPRPWLLADIGGTNARFGWLGGAGRAAGHVKTLRVAEHASPAAAARVYLAALRDELGASFSPPVAAAFAVATAVAGDRVAFTNSGWTFSQQETRLELGLRAFRVLNDFEALALSLPHLAPAQLQAIGPALPGDRAALAVIGPGTGLGVAGIVPTPRGWVAVPGEGGHATLAPADEFESALLVSVRREYAHVSAERLLSGIGLPVLYRGVADVMGLPAVATSAEQIVERGLSGQDAVASRAIDAFCALLGNFAGSVALTLGARGGVFIGGGIVPRLGERFHASNFRQRFEAKGRFDAYLAAIPTALIIDTLVALTGCAVSLEQQPA